MWKKYVKRLGIKKEEFNIRIKIIRVAISVPTDCEITAMFIRGPQKDETHRAVVKKPPDGSTQKIIFNAEFERVSGFYQELHEDGSGSAVSRYQAKMAQLKVRKFDMLNPKGEDLAEVNFDLSHYINKGKQKDSL